MRVLAAKEPTGGFQKSPGGDTSMLSWALALHWPRRRYLYVGNRHGNGGVRGPVFRVPDGHGSGFGYKAVDPDPNPENPEPNPRVYGLSTGRAESKLGSTFYSQ
ncbi:hypothetical protein GGX14DRAFT_397775 [Mycena pura]|uniref:Uncharacterized protein n=1 Tax=Mycena pura TaxID=153505 RepID=A0AAD6V7Z6_9AGAR|nr:hypothetical protein GGX14DRAFT_397775 [Mycena pura]